jgi:hypothetical protein
MQGMDMKHDKHPCCVVKTTNLKNDYGLIFRWTTCANHLCCIVDNCPGLMRDGVATNEIHWEGATNNPFQIGNVPPTHSTIIYRYCKNPSSYMANCDARIYGA